MPKSILRLRPENVRTITWKKSENYSEIKISIFNMIFKRFFQNLDSKIERKHGISEFGLIFESRFWKNHLKIMLKIEILISE